MRHLDADAQRAIGEKVAAERRHRAAIAARTKAMAELAPVVTEIEPDARIVSLIGADWLRVTAYVDALDDAALAYRLAIYISLERQAAADPDEPDARVAAYAWNRVDQIWDELERAGYSVTR